MKVFEEIKKVLLKKTGKEVTMETSLKDLQIDSLDLLTFVLELEEKFGASIDEEKLQNVKTIGDVVNLFKE